MLSTFLALSLAAGAATEPAGLHGLLVRTAYDPSSGHFAYQDAQGKRLALTFDRDLQQPLQRFIYGYHVPLAQLVAIEPATGRVLAESESKNGDGPHGARLG